MTIPGVGSITALGLIGVIGEVSRFASAQKLVGYLGLDPKVRQSGERAQRTGHISRQGQAHDGSQAVADLMRALVAENVPVEDLSLRRPTLDDAFLSLTGRRAEPEAADTPAPVLDEVG